MGYARAAAGVRPVVAQIGALVKSMLWPRIAPLQGASGGAVVSRCFALFRHLHETVSSE